MAGVRIVRYVLFALLCVLIIFFVTSSSRSSTNAVVPDTVRATYSGLKEQWNHYTGTSATARERTEKELIQGSSGRTQQSTLIPSKAGPKMNATFVTLARNSDLWEIVQSIRAVEDRFNHQFGYDWVFLNDQPFNDEFKKVTTALISGKTKYGLIPEEHWSFPSWIDQNKAAAVRQDMHERKIIYGDSISYRHMCRFESGFFFRQPLMMDYEWYWRVEPSIKLFCDIPYDPFEFMAKNNKMYSFTLSLHEYSETIPTLWNSTKNYIKKHPEHIAEGNSMEFLSDDGGETYNGCHFWSNFEIGNLNFLRSKAYVDYFETLDQDGGFFYERWGDAPIHSIAAGLLLPKEQLHFFNDIAYYHVPFTHCPLEESLRLERKCSCDPGENFDWNGYSCTAKYYDLHNLKKPAGAPLNRVEKRIRILEWVLFGIFCGCVLAYIGRLILLRYLNRVSPQVRFEKLSVLGEEGSLQQDLPKETILDRWLPSWLMTEIRAIRR